MGGGGVSATRTYNHLEEMLLDQAQARASYTPLLGGHSCFRMVKADDKNSGLLRNATKTKTDYLTLVHVLSAVCAGAEEERAVLMDDMISI